MKELKQHISGAAKSRNPKRQSKRYAFYNQLMFLMPNMRAKKGSKNAANLRRFKSEMEHVEIQIDESNPPIEECNVASVSLSSDQPTEQQLYQHEAPACETTFDTPVPGDVLSSVNGPQRSDEDDYDKMFLLSLLPSFRSIPEHMKLHIRIQMQQVLASAFHPNNLHSE